MRIFKVYSVGVAMLFIQKFNWGSEAYGVGLNHLAIVKLEKLQKFSKNCLTGPFKCQPWIMNVSSGV
jgi:hypothetical protein